MLSGNYSISTDIEHCDIGDIMEVVLTSILETRCSFLDRQLTRAATSQWKINVGTSYVMWLQQKHSTLYYVTSVSERKCCNNSDFALV